MSIITRSPSSLSPGEGFEVPLFAPDEQTIGIVYEDDGTVFDHVWSWESGQTYANHGYRVVAVAPVLSRFDGSVYMTVEALQELFDYERRIAADCFGPGVRS